MTAAVSMVFFSPQAGGYDLEWAHATLSENGLEVEATPRGLAVSCDEEGPVLRIVLANGGHVAEEATEIGAGSAFEQTLRACTARFEIAIDDLDEALDEMNTLIEVQASLQDGTRGVLFNSWNGELSA